MYGPTYFEEFLKKVVGTVEEQVKKNEKTYNVLMIMTDGEISDMVQTKDQIVRASSLPLSIIIIGVGNEDFANMIELDGDNAALRDSNGRTASRDIV